nr:AMP-binding protein [Sphingosinithalassobacter portus]
MISGAMQDYALTLDKFIDHAAKWHPTGKIVTAREGGSTVRATFAEVRERARRFSALLAGLGIGVGDHVATLAWNCQVHVEAWYGIMGMGAVCHTLNPRITAAQLGAMVQQSQAKLIIASADLLPLARDVAALAPNIQAILIDGDVPANGNGAVRILSVDAALAATTQTVPWGDFDERTPAGLCFTSGTTGAPKGVTYTHRSNFLHANRLLQADVFGITRRDVVLPAVPMFHANAWGIPFAAPSVGAGLVLPGRHTDGESLARLIRDEGVTVAVGVPTVWVGLVDYIERAAVALPSLKRIMVGGAPMPPALMQRIETILGVTVQTSWGMTELSPLGTISMAGDPERAAGNSGRPALGIDLMLFDASGTPLAEQRGTEGHLHVRGPAVVERYFGQEQSATNADGWFDTGDLAIIDAHGNLTITGRSKDLIKSGGEWINPAEIEALVTTLPQVSFAAVIGRNDPKWGERPLLLVELRGDASIEDEALLAPLNGRIAPWWVPDAVIRLDNMPLASTGKIDKIRLRAEYSGS